MRRVWHRPDLLVVMASGDIDLGSVPDLVAALSGDVPPVMVVDLSKATFLSVAGLHVLVETAERVFAHHSRFGLVTSDRLALRVLRLSGMAASIPIYSSLSDAVRELAAPTQNEP